MKYYSENESVQSALNKTKWQVILPFFIIYFLLVILGFYIMLAYQIKNNWFPITIIFGGISVMGVVCHFLSIYWFKNSIKKVTDPTELFERALRYNMILPSSARKILQSEGIQLTARQLKTKENLEPVEISKDLLLTNDTIRIMCEEYSWIEIEDFKISPISTSSTGLYRILILHFKNNTNKSYYLKIDDMTKAEYLIDKYFNNKKSRSIKYKLKPSDTNNFIILRLNSDSINTK